MSPHIRKLALSAHLAFSVGWVGSAIAYLFLGITAASDRDDATIRGAWMAMELIGWYVIVPLAVASLITGLLMAFGTEWGVFRHYWVLFSLVLTIVATVVLLLHMPDVSAAANLVRDATGGHPAGTHEQAMAQLDDGDIVHPGLGLIVLLAIHVLNVFKPRGLTHYGLKHQRMRRRARTTLTV